VLQGSGLFWLQNNEIVETGLVKLVSAEELAKTLGDASKTSNGWKCKCPAHTDSRASMTIFLGKDGRDSVHCFAGCDERQIYAAIRAQGFELESRQLPSKRTQKPKVIIPAPMPFPKNAQLRGLGSPSQVYQYHTEKGELAYVVCRFDQPGGKTIRPASFVEDKGNMPKWDWKLPLERTLLYNLHHLKARPDDVVLVVEGEKAADHAQHIFPDYVVTTSQGGSKSWKKADWSPLKGRRVLLWPDNDQPGLMAFTELGTSLHTVAESIDIAYVPRVWPSGWDLADPIPDGFDLSAVQWRKAPVPSMDSVLESVDTHNYMEVFDALYWLYHNGEATYTLSKQKRDASKGRPCLFTTQGFAHRINKSHPSYRKAKVPYNGGLADSINVWESERMPDRIEAIQFRPDVEEQVFVEDGTRIFNAFTGWAYEPAFEGSCELFKAYLLDVLCAGDKEAYVYLWNFLSHLFQYPHEKPNVAVVFKGIEGTGKSFFGTVLQQLLGGDFGYSTVVNTTSGLLNTFNDHLVLGKLGIFIHELEITKGGNAMNLFKNLISDLQIQVNAKYQQSRVARNYTRIFAATNHEHIWSMSSTDRRICVLEVSDHRANDAEYFKAVLAELREGGYRRLMYELIHHQVNMQMVRVPLKNEARQVQAVLTPEPAKDLAYKWLRHGVIEVQVLNQDTRQPETFFRVDGQSWSAGGVLVATTPVRLYLEQMIRLGNYRENFTARDKRASFAGVMSWLFPYKSDAKYTSTAYTERAERTKCAGYMIPKLEDCRRYFAEKAGVSYDRLFEAPENVVEFPNRQDQEVISMAERDVPL
jgi:hypothetical protein